MSKTKVVPVVTTTSDAVINDNLFDSDSDGDFHLDDLDIDFDHDDFHLEKISDAHISEHDTAYQAAKQKAQCVVSNLNLDLSAFNFDDLHAELEDFSANEHMERQRVKLKTLGFMFDHGASPVPLPLENPALVAADQATPELTTAAEKVRQGLGEKMLALSSNIIDVILLQLTPKRTHAAVEDGTQSDEYSRVQFCALLKSFQNSIPQEVMASAWVSAQTYTAASTNTLNRKQMQQWWTPTYHPQKLTTKTSQNNRDSDSDMQIESDSDDDDDEYYEIIIEDCSGMDEEDFCSTTMTVDVKAIEIKAEAKAQAIVAAKQKMEREMYSTAKMKSLSKQYTEAVQKANEVKKTYIQVKATTMQSKIELERAFFEGDEAEFLPKETANITELLAKSTLLAAQQIETKRLFYTAVDEIKEIKKVLKQERTTAKQTIKQQIEKTMSTQAIARKMVRTKSKKVRDSAKKKAWDTSQKKKLKSLMAISKVQKMTKMCAEKTVKAAQLMEEANKAVEAAEKSQGDSKKMKTATDKKVKADKAAADVAELQELLTVEKSAREKFDIAAKEYVRQEKEATQKRIEFVKEARENIRRVTKTRLERKHKEEQQKKTKEKLQKAHQKIKRFSALDPNFAMAKDAYQEQEKTMLAERNTKEQLELEMRELVAGEMKDQLVGKEGGEREGQAKHPTAKVNNLSRLNTHGKIDRKTQQQQKMLQFNKDQNKSSNKTVEEEPKTPYQKIVAETQVKKENEKAVEEQIKRKTEQQERMREFKDKEAKDSALEEKVQRKTEQQKKMRKFSSAESKKEDTEKLTQKGNQAAAAAAAAAPVEAATGETPAADVAPAETAAAEEAPADAVPL